MKKARMIIAALVFTATAGSLLGASAAHCGSGGSNGHSPFNSCENGTPGAAECGAGPTVPGVGTITTTPASGHGAEACISGLPLGGRAGVWARTDGGVTVYADGDDSKNPGDLAGWTRVDVSPDAESCKVRVRRGAAGQWANDQEGGTTSDAQTDECAA